MLLVIDVGNTQTCLALYSTTGSKILAPIHNWRVSTQSQATPDEITVLLRGLLSGQGHSTSQLQGAVIGSVVPWLENTYQQVCGQGLGIKSWIAGKDLPIPTRNLYKNPQEVGTDRLLNAVAAFERVHQSCVVVDFGTATTFDCVGQRGEYIGGAIAPGPASAMEALTQKAAKLPPFSEFQAPLHPIGKTTLESMRSGVYYGYIGLVKEILVQLKRTMPANAKVLGTGGLSNWLCPAIGKCDLLVPYLTLEGLYLSWKKAKKRRN